MYTFNQQCFQYFTQFPTVLHVSFPLLEKFGKFEKENNVNMNFANNLQ